MFPFMRKAIFMALAAGLSLAAMAGSGAVQAQPPRGPSGPPPMVLMAETALPHPSKVPDGNWSFVLGGYKFGVHIEGGWITDVLGLGDLGPEFLRGPTFVAGRVLFYHGQDGMVTLSFPANYFRPRMSP